MTEIPEIWQVQAVDAHDTHTSLFLSEDSAKKYAESLDDHGYTWISISKSKGLDAESKAILFE